MNMTHHQSNDQLAKLLAHENINIIRGNVRTASFDIKNRVLVLPRWKDMSKEAEQMLIGHEVGHALFTSLEKYGKVFEKENKHLRGYANIVEDARIEARMKERYPGLRKTFVDGYKYLNDKDFFGIKGRDINKLLLIDRINLYFKLGYTSGVKFTPEEQVFVQRVERCTNETEVLALAEEIYEYSKKKKQDILSQLDDLLAEEKFSDESEEDEYDFDDFDADEESDDIVSKNRQEQTTSNKSYGDFKDGVDPEIAPETLDRLESKLSEYADDSIHFEYFEPTFHTEFSGDVVIGYQRVISELKGRIEAREAISRKQVDDFKMTTSSMVNYLVKEFEMRKSASAYKRAKISKLGQLNTNKLYAYKIKDDIFKQVMTVKDGKKHGMVFLLDWSGSMMNNINETVEQLINLAMFCQKCQISYRVFAFTDGYGEERYYEQTPKVINQNGLGKDCDFKLLELFSDKMTNAEFNSMISLMLNRPWRFRDYGLNGTPLEEAMVYMVKFLEKFKIENKVEKLSFITLTDGEGGELYGIDKGAVDGMRYIGHKHTRVKCILRDPITKKEYPLGENANTQMIAFRNLIRDRLDARVLGFYIISRNTNEIRRFIKNNIEKDKRTMTPEEIQTSLRRDKYSLVEMNGYDEFYLLTTTKIEDEALENVKPEMSAAAISNRLSKMMNAKRVSRVVLDRFIGHVS